MNWPGSAFHVRAFGARGNGENIDIDAINRAIAAASDAGGGTVVLPAGRYASYSIRLKSRVRLHLESGAEILAAEPTPAAGFDVAEDAGAPAGWQDFGHSHWHNSLIWGEDLQNIAIDGPGLIDGHALVNGDTERGRPPAKRPGIGNKAIALRQCTNVALRDFSVLRGGHFGILCSGVSDAVIERVRIDTNRDGINLDCCRRVRIVGCAVNSPNDDGICLKSTLTFGAPVPTEDIVITGCTLRGNHEIGAMLDGSLRPMSRKLRSQVYQPTGRIKLGTESNGGFRRIRITDNIFYSCRGLALETVDGGVLEDVEVAGLVMHDVRTAPIFIRLGARLRGPAGQVPGAVRGVVIRDVEAEQTTAAMPILISGIPGHPIEDVRLDNVHLRTIGGGTAKMAKLVPPELPKSYPEPELFGINLPACGMFARHVKDLEVRNFSLECARPDARPAFWLRDIGQAAISVARLENVPTPTDAQEVARLEMEGVG